MAHPLPGNGKNPKKPVNHERWVISYADLLTLLLATFVVLYASSHRDLHKQDEIAQSFVKAFHGTPPSVVSAPAAGRGVMPHEPSPVPLRIEAPASANSRIPKRLEHQLAAEVRSLKNLEALLKTLLQPQMARHEVSIQSQPLTLTIKLDASVLFASGQANLKPQAITLLRQVGATLIKLPAPFSVAVQGYTDNKPINTAAFPSNWSLSAERAVRVVELFWRDGVPGQLLTAEGFGQFSPIAANTSAAGRALNRRVLVVIHAPDPTLK